MKPFGAEDYAKDIMTYAGMTNTPITDSQMELKILKKIEADLRPLTLKRLHTLCQRNEMPHYNNDTKDDIIARVMSEAQKRVRQGLEYIELTSPPTEKPDLTYNQEIELTGIGQTLLNGIRDASKNGVVHRLEGYENGKKITAQGIKEEDKIIIEETYPEETANGWTSLKQKRHVFPIHECVATGDETP